MKRKVLFIIIILLGCSINIWAQNDESDEITFEPIHSTIVPGTLNIDESYSKNYSVSISGDDLILTLIKPNKLISNGEIPSAEFNLPVNPRQDYEIKFDFICPKFGNASSIILLLGQYVVILNKNAYSIVNSTNKDVIAHNPKKWELPKEDNKGQITLTFEKKRKIITVFANGKYLAEINDAKNNLNEMPVKVSFNDLQKNSTLYLKSIKVDQGIVTND